MGEAQKTSTSVAERLLAKMLAGGLVGSADEDGKRCYSIGCKESMVPASPVAGTPDPHCTGAMTDSRRGGEDVSQVLAAHLGEWEESHLRLSLGADFS